MDRHYRLYNKNLLVATINFKIYKYLREDSNLRPTAYLPAELIVPLPRIELGSSA